jgi:hypothetical protein
VIIARGQWGAKFGRGNATSGAKPEFYVHHSAARRLSPASTPEQEAAEVRRIEAYHAGGLTVANPRVGYTFLVAPSGRVYEGTGWDRVGAHTSGRNSSAYAACLLMDGESELPTPAAVQALNELRILGVRLGKLAPDHRFLGHRDAPGAATACPGKLVWPVTVGVTRGAAVPYPPVAAKPASPVLKLGAGGSSAPAEEMEAVRTLQRLLSMDPRHQTGFFGPLTEGALKRFQAERGLAPDGIVGERTWAALRTQ